MKKILVFILSMLIVFVFTSCDNMDIKEDITETIVEKILGDNAQVEITYLSPNPENTPQPTPDNKSGNNYDNNSTSDNNSDNENKKNDNNKSTSVDDSTWPKEIPSKVPKTSIEIVNKMKTPKGIILDFGEVEKIVAKQYTDRLKNDRYETVREEINNKMIEATYKKDEISANVSWYKGGAFTLMLTWD